MKINLITSIALTFLFKIGFAQYEIRGSDNICGSGIYQLYYNGALNTNPITWHAINQNPKITFTNSSNSQTTVNVIDSTAYGCWPAITTFWVKNQNNEIIASIDDVLIDCGTFPIVGPNTINYSVTTIFNIPRSYITHAQNCYGYSVWVASPNIEIIDTTLILNSTKIFVRRIDSGPAFIDFFIGDGRAYRKNILPE